MLETVISDSMEIWQRNAHRTEKGTEEEANQLIEADIEEDNRTETTIREEEVRMRQEEEEEEEEEERDEDNEMEGNMERDREELDELLSDERQRKDTQERPELESRMQNETRIESDEAVQRHDEADNVMNMEERRMQMMGGLEEARVEQLGESQRSDASHEHRGDGQEGIVEMYEIERTNNCQRSSGRNRDVS
jgi:hypothetical protein